jgi:hypothetical protein
MIYAGISGSVGIWGDILVFAAALAPGLADIVAYILIILVNIASLGGFAVIVGGYLLTTNRFGTGKFVIGIAAGMGLIGLLILIGEMYMAIGFEAFIQVYNLIANSTGLIGVVLTIVGRTIAKKPE